MSEASDSPVYRATFEYRAKLLRTGYWRFTLRLHGVFLIGAIIVCLVFLVSWVYHPRNVIAASLASFFAGICLVYGGGAIRAASGIEARIGELRSPEVQLILDGGSLHVESSGVSATYAWEVFRALHRFEKVWILCEARDRPLIYVDPTALSSEGRAFLEAKVREHRGQVC